MFLYAVVFKCILNEDKKIDRLNMIFSLVGEKIDISKLKMKITFKDQEFLCESVYNPEKSFDFSDKKFGYFTKIKDKKELDSEDLIEIHYKLNKPIEKEKIKINFIYEDRSLWENEMIPKDFLFSNPPNQEILFDHH